MKFLEAKESFLPNYTKKYTFINDKHWTVEFVYVDRPPEHIICISCMYGCPVWCGFCKSGTKFFGNLSFEDMRWILNYIAEDKKLFTTDQKIVFSFMWSWESLINYENVVQCINKITDTFPTASISLATSWVQIKNLPLLASKIANYPKIQLSFHSPFDEERKKLIPNTADLNVILDILSDYHSKHNAKITLNYIVLDGINDTVKHVKWIKRILEKYPFSFKINEYHDVGTWYAQSKHRDRFIAQLHKEGIFPKVYDTGWVDIWAACGQLSSEKMGDVLA